MVGEVGLEPTKASASGFTVRPLCRSGHSPERLTTSPRSVGNAVPRRRGRGFPPGVYGGAAAMVSTARPAAMLGEPANLRALAPAEARAKERAMSPAQAHDWPAVFRAVDRNVAAWTPQTLRAAYVAHGCAVVRGAIDGATIARVREATEAIYARTRAIHVHEPDIAEETQGRLSGFDLV